MTGVEETKVRRVGLEIENIGERVPSSKKRLSWRFVFEDSEEVHTVTLEHSRVSAKKRVKLDGKRIGASESYTAGPWTFDFTVPTHPHVPFQVVIKDVNSLGLLERARANLNPDVLYSFWVNGQEWEKLQDRPSKYENFGNTNRWSSNSYCRRVQYTVDVNAQQDVRVSWLFTFGQDGAVHQLLLEDCADGSRILVLDRMSLRHDQPTDSALTLDLADANANANAGKKEAWMAQHFMGEDEHELVVRILHEGNKADRKYSLHVNGCAFEDMAETDYVLQPGFYPVHSKSTGKVYYREDTTKQTKWDKPIVPRKASSPSTDTESTPSPYTGDKTEALPSPVDTKPVDLDDLIEQADLMAFSDDEASAPAPAAAPAPPAAPAASATHAPAPVVDLLA